MTTLVDQCARLSDLYRSILDFDFPVARPPIIDLCSSNDDSKNVLPGLRFLRDEVKRDRDLLNDFLREPSIAPPPSTNAPYLIAVWDELVHARQPVAIYRTFYPTTGNHNGKTRRIVPNGKSRMRAVKVDVVAENGARWVRVNTIKHTRLTMEFREMDSYLTSDEDEDRITTRTEFDNSVLRMGKELLDAAKANPIPDSNLGSITPHVTIRFTRLDPFLEDDPRIQKTIQYLRDMGINVELGDRSHLHYPPIPKIPPKTKSLEPTANVNLDLSALIALISDISHSPLPQTEEEAHTRFEPPQYRLDWKKDRVKPLAHKNQNARRFPYDGGDGEDHEGTRENSGQYSRTLATQTIHEMSKGVLEEMHERLSTVTHLTGVTFWTTSEARQRCLQIVSKIGGERERKRADALLGSTYCTRMSPLPAPAHIANGMSISRATPDVYWEHSRYPAGLLPLAPVRIYPSTFPADSRLPRTSFFDALTRTCTQILSQETTPVPLVSTPPNLSPSVTDDALHEIPPAPQTSLPKLTVHTATSMFAGASRGYTTLTTNKSSVKVILKEMQRVCGRGACVSDPLEAKVRDVERAVLWILGPRSLSEGMRSE